MTAPEPPTDADLRAAMLRQARFLVASGNLVAAGDPDEALRLAVSIRVLVHDTQSSHSILGQLGIKDQLDWVNSLRPIEVFPGIVFSLGVDDGTTIEPGRCLTVLGLAEDGSLRYQAPLGRDPVTATCDFDEWWTTRCIDTQWGPTFSRKDLVLTMANKDGGAHIDPGGLPVDYAEYRTTGGGHLTIPGDPLNADGSLPETISAEALAGAVHAGDAASPSVLQIAWELLETLTRAGLLPSPPA